MFQKIIDWFASLVIQWLLNMIATGGVEKLAHEIQAKIIPKIRQAKNEAMARMKAEAAANNDQGGVWPRVDDAVWEVVDRFLDALIPANPVQTLADVRQSNGDSSTLA